MGLVTHRILFKHYGEVCYTSKSPVDVYVEGMVDLEETIQCLASSDNWMLVPTKLYEVKDVTLPDWMTPKEWVRSEVKWRYTWGRGCPMEWPEKWQRFLFGMDGAGALAVIKLLKTAKFRSEFRASLRAQLEAWLDTPDADRQYDSPFSKKQWARLIDRYTAIEARRIDEAIYYSR